MSPEASAMLDRIRERRASEPAAPAPAARQAVRLARLIQPRNEETGR